MQEQNSTHETGVSSSHGSKELTRARSRKANAALALAIAGADWKDIARACGYPTARAAKVAVELACEKRLTTMDKEHFRMLVSGRLDTLLRSTWAKATDPDHPDHLPAVGKAREIIADHRKLFGLDAPMEVTVTSPTQEQLDEWVGRVVANGLPTVTDYDIVEGEVVDDDDIEEPGGPDAVQAG